MALSSYVLKVQASYFCGLQKLMVLIYNAERDLMRLLLGEKSWGQSLVP